MDERLIKTFVEGGEGLIDKFKDLYSAVSFFKKNFEFSVLLIIPLIQTFFKTLELNIENIDSELKYPEMASIAYVFGNELIYWDELNKG